MKTFLLLAVLAGLLTSGDVTSKSLPNGLYGASPVANISGDRGSKGGVTKAVALQSVGSQPAVMVGSIPRATPPEVHNSGEVGASQQGRFRFAAGCLPGSHDGPDTRESHLISGGCFGSNPVGSTGAVGSTPARLISFKPGWVCGPSGCRPAASLRTIPHYSPTVRSFRTVRPFFARRTGRGLFHRWRI